jgi:hypothetical protein
MRRTITLSTFRKLEAAEETMLRAMMPRTAAADTTPLTSPIRPAKAARAVWRNGRRVAAAQPLTFTLAEVR